ncbi:HD domain-containing phosphohydrolase [Maridesulfovibrio zosterae]|uniref:HD domain-containing phosphohydrolase n=1 Tax=Maridesulfovibrio zosterae TaxID=82171 RepID=UPI000400D3EE|nr:HD domain-containing phosphohydrolase [Maridesulfovibrio zosterae]
MENNYSNDLILFVDDEPNVLSSYRRILHSKFKILTALGGKAALDVLGSEPHVKVIISDIKMPEMNGIELLSKVRELYPDTVRMVLTGYADLEIAMDAVNQGDIFRFLTKPCSPDNLTAAVTSGIKQYQMVQDSRELVGLLRIKEGLQGTLKAFTRLVEIRDPYTAGHMDRTADISVTIASKIGFDENVIEGLRLAALVHDIGKIAVPSGILNKPGKLSEAEFSIIKTHPLVGAEIFKTMETQWPIRRIILEHHERIDGSGYPYGLKGDELLHESKIIAVADYIDAVLTDRPYRRSLGIDKILNILDKEKGVSLDAQCAEVGIKLIHEGQISEHYIK